MPVIGGHSAGYETNTRRGFLSISIVVTRLGRPGGEAKISIEDWMDYVEKNPSLRMRMEPDSAFNPVTGEEIKITRPATAAEILVDGNWSNFLWWRNGELFTKYHSDFDNPVNSIRQAIVAIARHFSSKIMTDVDNGPLDW
jgi:hypothetical protein